MTSEQVQSLMFPIVLKENQPLPIQRLMESKENNSFKPITPEDSSICLHLSEAQQHQLQNSISKINKFHELFGKVVKEEKTELGMELSLSKTCNFKKSVDITQYIPSFLKGEEVTETSSYYYDFLSNVNQVQIKVDQESNEVPGLINEITYCLIYNGESKEELNETIVNLNQQKLSDSQSQEIEYSKSIFVLVAGVKNFKKILLNSLQPNDKDEINLFFEKYQGSENFGYFIENNDFCKQVDVNSLEFSNKFIENQVKVYFIVFPKIFDRIQLQRWIFQGISKFLDPTYLIVCDSNQVFEKTFLYECLRRIHENTVYFGLQWRKQYLSRANSIILNNQNLMATDSLFSIKKFHDPLNCVYKWQSVSYHIEGYFFELNERQKYDDCCYCENSIFTSLIFQNAGLKLFYLNSVMSRIRDQKENLHNLMTKVGNKIYNSQKQLNQSVGGNFESFDKFIQRVMGKIFSILNYFSLSLSNYICKLVLSFCVLNPYQLLCYAFDSKRGYFILSLLLPALYCLTFVCILLLSSSYRINNKIQGNEIYVKDQNNKYFKLPEKFKKINLVQLRKFLTDLGYEMSRSPSNHKIQEKFEFLFILTQIYDVALVLFTICNIIVLYGLQLTAIQNIFVMTSSLIAVVILLLEGWIFGFYQITKLLLISKYYVSLSKIHTADIQILKKKKLAEELALNFFFSLIFIIIVVYYNFTGYALLSLLFVILFVKLLEYFMLLIQKIVSKLQQNTKHPVFKTLNIKKNLQTNSMNKNFQELVEIIDKYKETRVNEEKELEENQKKIYKQLQEETRNRVKNRIASQLAGN